MVSAKFAVGAVAASDAAGGAVEDRAARDCPVDHDGWVSPLSVVVLAFARRWQLQALQVDGARRPCRHDGHDLARLALVPVALRVDPLVGRAVEVVPAAIDPAPSTSVAILTSGTCRNPSSQTPWPSYQLVSAPVSTVHPCASA